MMVEGEGTAAGATGGVPELTADEIFNNTFTELSADGPVIEAEDGATGHEETAGATGATGAEGALPDPAHVAARGATGPTGEATPPVGATGATGPAPAVGATGATGPADKPIEQVLRELLGQQRQPEPVKPEPPKPEPYKPPDYTPEQKAIVDAYEAEFPEMARAEQIIRSREYHAVTQYIFSQMQPIVQGQAERIVQLENLIASMDGRQQAQQIETTIGANLAEIKPKIEAWIETQPEFIRPAYKAIAERGTAQEVVGLVQAWKAAQGAPVGATGATGAPVGATGATGTAVIRTPVAPIGKAPPKVPAGLRPVPSVRTQPQEAGIPRDDFDGAFTAFASQGTG